MKLQKIIIGTLTVIIVTLGIITVVRYIPFFGLSQLYQKSVTTEATMDSRSSEQEAQSSDQSKTPAESLPLVVNIEKSEQIDEMLEKTGPLVIKFYSDWCPACIAAKAVYPSIAQALAGNVSFYALNVQNETLVNEMVQKGLIKDEIEAIPTFAFYQKGKVKDTVRGFAGKEGLEQQVKEHFDL